MQAQGPVSARWCEELEGDAVRVTEAHARAVAGVLDTAVLHAQLVESTRPSLELPAVRTSERDVVEADTELAECLIRCWRPVLMDADERVAEEIDDVVHVGVGVLVEHRLAAEQRLVP